MDVPQAASSTQYSFHTRNRTYFRSQRSRLRQHYLRFHRQTRKCCPWGGKGRRKRKGIFTLSFRQNLQFTFAVLVCWDPNKPNTKYDRAKGGCHGIRGRRRRRIPPRLGSPHCVSSWPFFCPAGPRSLRDVVHLYIVRPSCPPREKIQLEIHAARTAFGTGSSGEETTTKACYAYTPSPKANIHDVHPSRTTKDEEVNTARQSVVGGKHCTTVAIRETGKTKTRFKMLPQA